MADDQRHVIVEDETLAAGFTQIPNLVLRRPDLQPGAKLTYMVLLSYAWQQDHAYPGQDRLAVDMGVSERSVITYLKQLVDAGLVTIRRRGLGMTNIYVLHRLTPRSENFASLEVQQSTVLEVQDLQPKKTQKNKTQREEVDSKGLSLIVDNDDARAALAPFAQDLAREFNDQAPLRATTTRLTNLFHASGLDLDAFLALVIRARAITQQHTGSIRTPRPEGLGPKPKMGYWFSVLEDLIDRARAATSTGTEDR